MSIDFHEPELSREAVHSSILEIIEPRDDRNWAIGFNANSREELEAYDEAVKAILQREMLIPGFDVTQSTDTRHVWLIGDKSIEVYESNEVAEHLAQVTKEIDTLAHHFLTKKAA